MHTLDSCRDADASVAELLSTRHSRALWMLLVIPNKIVLQEP